MKKQPINILVILLLVEFFLIYLYFYFQPECVPCRPNVYCPPCISNEQKVVRVLLLLLPIVISVILMIRKKMKTFHSSK